MLRTTESIRAITRERINFFIDALHAGEKVTTTAEDISADMLDTSDRENYYALRGIGYDHHESLSLIKQHLHDEDVTLWDNFEALARMASSR